MAVRCGLSLGVWKVLMALLLFVDSNALKVRLEGCK